MTDFSFITGYYDDEDNHVIPWANYSRSVSTPTVSNRPPWQGRFGHLDLDSGYQEYEPVTIQWAAVFDVGRALVNPVGSIASAAVIQHSNRVLDLVPWQYRTDLPQ